MYGFNLKDGFIFYKYRDFDGSVSLSKEHVRWFYNELKDNSQLKVVFYDGSIDSFEEFYELVNLNEQHFFFGFKSGQPAAIFWLNGLDYKSCYVHLSIFPSHYGKGTLVMGRGVLKHLLTATDVSGSYIFDCIKGFIPEFNQLACKMAEKSGFDRVGVVPCGIYNAKQDQSQNGVLFCATRDGLLKQSVTS